MASSVTISRWVRQLVVQVYNFEGRIPPLPVTAHSAKAISASWVRQHQASVSQAATWSSVHTFTKFMMWLFCASLDAFFGHKVLQEAV